MGRIWQTQRNSVELDKTRYTGSHDPLPRLGNSSTNLCYRRGRAAEAGSSPRSICTKLSNPRRTSFSFAPRANVCLSLGFEDETVPPRSFGYRRSAPHCLQHGFERLSYDRLRPHGSHALQRRNGQSPGTSRQVSRPRRRKKARATRANTLCCGAGCDCDSCGGISDFAKSRTR
jgi:hypothetical protein